jgi:formylglycine-generating enzyme
MMKLNLVRVSLAALLLSILPAASQAGTATFGSGANTFTMDFTTIGNPGNAADTTSNPSHAGSVGYEYEIGKFEVSEDMIAKYNALNPELQITMDMRGPNKPATNVSWNEAARFVNWLNNSTGNQAAYKFTTNGVNDDIDLWTSGEAGYDSSNPYRNSLAKYVLPSYNEWYKAAYYDPNKNSGAGGYWDYPNGSNTAPVAVASGTANATAVYAQSFGQGPADVDQAGGLSPYGIMGVGGNVTEWEESSYDLANSSGSFIRGVRGGDWSSGAGNLNALSRGSMAPSFELVGFIGFRVVSLSSSAPPVVPEPSMMVIGTLFGLGGLIARRRMKK